MFRYIPLILLLLIALIVAFGSNVPLEIKEIMYGFSISIKSFIICVIPLIIFSLLFTAAVKIAKDAPKLIILILGGVIISNFLATNLSYIVGMYIYQLDINIILPTDSNQLSYKQFIIFPSIIPNWIAMIAGIISGFFMATFSTSYAEIYCNILKNITNKILKIISWIIPLFVVGFILKMEHEGTVNQIFAKYPLIFATIALAQAIYIVILYLIGSKFSVIKAIKNIRNILPSAISGFGTMSSAASMPLLILGAEKNANNKDLTNTVVPATINIHLLGDCIAIPCFAFAILKTFGYASPSMLTYITFSLYFVVAKFSVAAIPGGGIMVMLPILSGHLDFNDEMLSLITAVYLLFDPVITSANVLGNGAFAKIIDTLALKKNNNDHFYSNEKTTNTLKNNA